MKKFFLMLLLVLNFTFSDNENVNAQCAICTKTVQQMGDKPARGFNSGIIYLMLTPFAVVGFVGYKWWKSNREF
jgi:hypothetical protein